MVQLTHIQFGEAKKLADSSNNPKNATLKYDNYRGYILAADGTVLARSVRTPAGSSYKYYRQYPGGALYSGFTGYSSLYYGTAGVESTYNDQSGSARPAGPVAQPAPQPAAQDDRYRVPHRPALSPAGGGPGTADLLGPVQGRSRDRPRPADRRGRGHVLQSQLRPQRTGRPQRQQRDQGRHGRLPHQGRRGLLSRLPDGHL